MTSLHLSRPRLTVGAPQHRTTTTGAIDVFRTMELRDRAGRPRARQDGPDGGAT